MANEATVDATPERKRVVESIAGQVQALPNGHRAKLRGLFLTERSEANGIVVGILYRAGLTRPMELDTFAPWRLLTHAAALIAGTGTRGDPPHAPGARLGDVFEAVGFSENRLSRLLSAHGAVLQDQVIRAIRMIAQQGKGPINLRTLYELICDDTDRSERARLRIAQEYYAAKARSEEETSRDD